LQEPDWYADWRHEAVHHLMTKIDAIKQRFRISDWPRWDYDMDACSLIFSEEGKPRVVAEVLLIGSLSDERNNWQWGWANTHWPKPVIAGMEEVRAFGETHAIEELTQGWVEDADDLNQRGWELSAVATRVLDGLGVYRPKTSNGAIFFMYRSIRLVE